ncbi:BCCT family transporter [Bacillota bacterium Meth-B3]|nr:BCCT family transporter [Christensenellaceae bacterium]MEA5067322.1 BCCT family transporter [Eubacteriales bacterium]MEA5067482.1 BCCT family transporter [Christensenellaceae bacterium]
MRTPKIDKGILIIPLCAIVLLSALLVVFSEHSRAVIEAMRLWVTHAFGWYYLVLGLLFFGVSLYVAFSARGAIRLGSLAKPRYGHFSWGAMVFTSTMAADILFFALHEWAFYYTALPLDAASLSLGERHLWASTYPMFHWGAIPWSFFLLPAAAYGYMFYVKGRSRQRLSEACRPVIGARADGALGKAIDLFSAFGLLAGTATTFSLSTPLITLALSSALGLKQSKGMTIAVLLVIALIYTAAVVFGFKGASRLSKLAIGACVLLACMFLLGSDPIYLIETTITALGNMASNFLRMATWLDPLRLTAHEGGGMAFPQSWTVFYWAYWIAWCVATPFFIARISEGRTIRQVILGGLAAGLLGTFTVFGVFGHYGLRLQVAGRLHVAERLAQGAPQAEVILEIIRTLPAPELALIALIAAMVLFYAATFDAATMVMAAYSYKNPRPDGESGRGVKAFWAGLFVLLPIGLLFSEQALPQLQAVAILAALPISAVLLVIVAGFLKESRR